MKVITLSLLSLFLTLSFSQTPVAVLSEQEVLITARNVGLVASYNAGYSQADDQFLYPGSPTYVQDLVELNPHAYGKLYAAIFQTEEIKLANRLSSLPRSQWANVLTQNSLTATVELAVNDIVARYSGYYEVPIIHVNNGCAVQVRFMAASYSTWAAGELCSTQTMITATQAQQLSGLSAQPKLVTFEHTDSGWGMMWLLDYLAVHPYTGEVFYVMDRSGTIVNPLNSQLDLEVIETSSIGQFGPDISRTYILPVQLQPVTMFQAGN